MKTSWVLSEDEKQRRFKKTKKVNIPLLIDVPFSTLEENMISNLNFNHMPWLRNFFMLNKDAAVSLVEYVYGRNNFHKGAWEVFKTSMGLEVI